MPTCLFKMEEIIAFGLFSPANPALKLHDPGSIITAAMSGVNITNILGFLLFI